MYAIEELVESFCPWCIADGSAAQCYDARFTGGVPVPDNIPREIVDVVTKRTPGFSGWQQEHWLYHCGDGAAFMGFAGWSELQELPAAVENVRAERSARGLTPEEVQIYLYALDQEGPPTAYLFRCLHCDTHLAYSDFAFLP